MIVMKNKQTNKKTKLNNMDKGKHQIQRAIFFFSGDGAPNAVLGYGINLLFKG